jgi:hypothetical protein
MEETQMSSSLCSEHPYTGWFAFYKFSAWAAVAMVTITVGQAIVFAVAPPPLNGTASDWFALFQKNSIIGLLNFELLLVFYSLFSIFVSLALFVILRPVNEPLTFVFLVLSIIGSICFVLARPAFEMLFLSKQFALATSEGQRASILAAGNAMVATFHGTAFQVSYFLGTLTGVLIAIPMMRSDAFSKWAAYFRIGSSIFDFGLFIPDIGIFLSLISVLFLLLFNILVARTLFKLGRTNQ